MFTTLLYASIGILVVGLVLSNVLTLGATCLVAIACWLIVCELIVCYFLRWRRRVLHVLIAIMLLGVMAIPAYHNGNQRWHREAPARAAQRLHAALLQSIANSFKQQGFALADTDPVILNPDNRSGRINVLIRWFPTTLTFWSSNDHWIAGCPTTTPGVSIPLAADNNRLAIVVQQTGVCHQGLDPPSSSPAG